MKAIISFKRSIITFSLCGLFLPAGGTRAAAAVVASPGETNQISAVDELDPARAAFSLTQSSRMLTLNFHGAPLKEVLSYLSDAAGFIVLPETEIKGTVDVWSDYPVTAARALAILDSVLRRNGYAAIREGKTLSIVTLEEAKRRAIPTETGGNPDLITPDEQVVTHILPVTSVNAAQALKELSPLLSSTADLNADEAGNALVMTDSRVNIRRTPCAKMNCYPECK